ncbi:MAG: chromosomal replication initiator protein DnaA [Bacteroidales bacterium]|nr:chromosomal replication initiator protein DnaA [Bacteroidales bacterium]
MSEHYIDTWKNCLKIIRDNIGQQSYSTWFEPIIPLELKDNVLTIQVPSQFFYEWIEEHYIDLLKKTIKSQLGPKGRLEYNIIVDSSLKSNPQSVKLPARESEKVENPHISVLYGRNNKEIPNPFVIPGLRKVNIHHQLKETYTFDNFIEGDCNRLARSAGMAVASNPGKTTFNPLFIYSATGLGKSHLIHAIGNLAKNNFPEKTVLYVSADQFTTQFTEAIRDKCYNDFVHFYQMIDLLLIDDIHFLVGKTRTQEVFFHIFNHMHQIGKQLVITSDKPPADLQGMEARLLSRFKWGLSAELSMPDFDTRVAIIKNKIYNDGITLSNDIIEYLAYTITTNVREIEGALISLIAHASFAKREVNLDLAKQLINNIVKEVDKEVSIDLIQKIVCDYFKVSVNMLNSTSRKREIVQARQLAMYFSKKHTKSSLQNIGTRCGNKDHATVLYACRTVNNLIETDKQFSKSVEEIDKIILISK